MSSIVEMPLFAEDAAVLSESSAAEDVEAPSAARALALSAVTRTVRTAARARPRAALLLALCCAAALCGVSARLASGILGLQAPGEAAVGAVTGLASKKKAKAKEEEDDDDDDESPCAKPFKQCGGEGWTGKSCCPSGCACIRQNAYYFACKTPHDEGDCDVDGAQEMAAELKAKADPLKKKAAQMKKLYEAKQKDYQQKKAKYDEAHAEAVGALHKSLAHKTDMHKVNETLQKLTAEMHRVGAEKDQALMWWGTVDNEKNSGCGTWTGDCTKSKCCQHGCYCNKTNPYYFQCGPPPGQSGCSVDLAKATAKKHAKTATGSKDKISADDAKAASKAADDAVAKKKEEFDEKVKAWEEVHATYVEFHEKAEKAKGVMDKAHRIAEKAEKLKDKAKKNIGQSAINADLWAKAAEATRVNV